MQLVAYGAQDVYLTGSPQITFFKTIYRRHTNFAIESIEQTFHWRVEKRPAIVSQGKTIGKTVSPSLQIRTDASKVICI